jgi:hypothetical protein
MVDDPFIWQMAQVNCRWKKCIVVRHGFYLDSVVNPKFPLAIRWSVRRRALAEIHLHARSALSRDNNFLSQAVWMMAGGISPVADAIEPVLDSEVADLLDRAREKWKDP